MTPILPSDAMVSEADLHALIDGQLTPERELEVLAWLSGRPEEAERVESYRAQKRELRALFDPVLEEPLPPRLQQPARAASPWRQPLAPWAGGGHRDRCHQRRRGLGPARRPGTGRGFDGPERNGGCGRRLRQARRRGPCSLQSRRASGL
jgi:anti-sigma factor RsiW